MSRKNDWQETDRILEQLRAQLNAEEQTPSEKEALTAEQREERAMLEQIINSMAVESEEAKEAEAARADIPQEEPAQVTEEPAEVTEEPAEVAEEPAEAAEEPADVTEEPADVTEEPADVTEEPAVAAEEVSPDLEEERPSEAEKTDQTHTVDDDHNQKRSRRHRGRHRNDPEEIRAMTEGAAEEAAAAKEAARERERRRDEQAQLLEQSLDWSGSAPKKNADPATVSAADAASTPPSAPDDERRESPAAEESEAKEPRRAERADSEIPQLTVEGLLNDIFGDTADTIGKRWFQGEEKKEVSFAPAEKQAKKASAAGEDGFVSPRRAEEAREDRTSARAATVKTPEKPAGGEEKPLDEEEGEALARPDLFSILSIERPRKKKKQERGSEPSRGERIALRRSVESTEDDFQFLLELDYEDELGSAIGFEKIREYRERDINGPRAGAKRRRHAEKLEYEAQEQDILLRKQYAAQKKGHIIRLIAASLLTLLLFIYERSEVVSSWFGGFLDGERYPVTYILIGMQLFLLAVLLARKHLLDGLEGLWRFKPIDHSLSAVMVLVTFLYHFVLLFLPQDGAPLLYFSPSATALALLSLTDLLNWYRESAAFAVISSRQQKYALIPSVSVGGRENKARARLLETEKEGVTWYARPVGFVRNYFANTEKRAEHNRYFGAQLLLILAIGLCCGLLVYTKTASFPHFFHTVFCAILICLPINSLLVTSFPLFFAACLRLGKKGAIIGEEPIVSSGERTTLVLPDTELFCRMDREQFEILDGNDTFHSMILIRALLERVGSPLAESVSVNPTMRMNPADFTLTDIATEGVSATGPNKTTIIMGSVAYLAGFGIHVKPRGDGDYEDLCRRLLCVAVGGRVTALFLARYRLTEEAESLLSMLRAENVQIMVRTKDPGVQNGIFARFCSPKNGEVQVIKPAAGEMDIRTDRVDATVVALGSSHELARTFVTCRRVRRAGHIGKLLQIGSIVVAVFISVLLSIFGVWQSLTALTVTLYMLFWCGLHAAISYFYLRDKENS